MIDLIGWQLKEVFAFRLDYESLERNYLTDIHSYALDTLLNKTVKKAN